MRRMTVPEVEINKSRVDLLNVRDFRMRRSCTKKVSAEIKDQKGRYTFIVRGGKSTDSGFGTSFESRVERGPRSVGRPWTRNPKRAGG